MRPNTRLAWIARLDAKVALALSATLAIVTFGCGDREAAVAARETMLIARIDSLRAAIADREALVYQGLSQPDLDDLKKRGLGDPEVELFDDLAQHPEVFPANVPPKPWVYRPDRSRTVVLSRDWVYAVVSDGHYEREALLKYAIEGPGRIRWECVRME